MTADRTASVVAAIEEWVRWEQVLLWSDLDDAIRSAVNGAWSIGASNTASRIVGAARLVGPTPIGDVDWRLTAGGVYEAVLTAGGVEVNAPTEDEWLKWEATMAGHGTRVTETPRFARTVAAIRADEEIGANDDAGR